MTVPDLIPAVESPRSVGLSADDTACARDRIRPPGPHARRHTAHAGARDLADRIAAYRGI